MATVFKRGPVWWIRFQYRGQRIERSARTTKKAEAQRYLVRVQDEMRQRDRDGYVRKTFDEMAERFIEEHLPLLKPRTAKGYHQHIRFMSAQFGNRHLDEIGLSHIAAYVQARRLTGASTATIRRHLASLSSMFSRAMGWGWITRNPVLAFDKRSIPEAKPRVRYLTPDEFRRLYECCSAHLRPIIELAVQTGMRSGELFGLTWDRVDLERREITLIETKSAHPRIVPMSDRAVAIIAAIPRHSASNHVLYQPATGRPYKTVRKAFSNACVRAGIENFRFHDLRHTFASWAVQNGMDLYRLSRILGHTTTSMTQRYAHLSTADLHNAIREMATPLAQTDPAHTHVRSVAAQPKPNGPR